MVGDVSGDAEIENHRHCLPYHIQKAYAAVVTYSFQDQDHHLQFHLLHDDSVPEFQLY